MESLDYLNVPIPVLRHFMTWRVALTSIRQVAAEVGVGRTTLHKFVAGETVPHLRIRRLYALFYLRIQSEGADEAVHAAAFSAAVDMLEQALPSTVRGGARKEIALVLQRLFERQELFPPTWLVAEATLDPEDQGDS